MVVVCTLWCGCGVVVVGCGVVVVVVWLWCGCGVVVVWLWRGVVVVSLWCRCGVVVVSLWCRCGVVIVVVSLWCWLLRWHQNGTVELAAEQKQTIFVATRCSITNPPIVYVFKCFIYVLFIHNNIIIRNLIMPLIHASKRNYTN